MHFLARVGKVTGVKSLEVLAALYELRLRAVEGSGVALQYHGVFSVDGHDWTNYNTYNKLIYTV